MRYANASLEDDDFGPYGVQTNVTNGDHRPTQLSKVNDSAFERVESTTRNDPTE